MFGEELTDIRLITYEEGHGKHFSMCARELPDQ